MVDFMADEDSESSMFLLMGSKVLKEKSNSNLTSPSPLLLQRQSSTSNSASKSASAINRTDSVDGANRYYDAYIAGLKITVDHRQTLSFFLRIS